MRALPIAAALLFVAGAAVAAPASVSVTIGPELQAKATKDLGQRDIDDLAKDLQRSVEKRLAKTGAYDGARIELQLTDAKPNRPTFKQMSDRPGLSFQSFSIGGAKIDGHAIAADGHVTPLSYSYFEPDIRWAHLSGTWSDAEWTIDRFAYQLGKGEVVANR